MNSNSFLHLRIRGLFLAVSVTLHYSKGKGNLSKLGAWIRKMFVLGNKNQFVISRKDSELVAMPITVMVLLMVLVWPFSLIVLFAGFFLGTRYAFRGPDINTTVNDFVNKAQDKVAVTVEAQVE